MGAIVSVHSLAFAVEVIVLEVSAVFADIFDNVVGSQYQDASGVHVEAYVAIMECNTKLAVDDVAA